MAAIVRFCIGYKPNRTTQLVSRGIVRRHAYGVSARYMLADYVILAGRADKLTFILQETGCGTVIELSIANA